MPVEVLHGFYTMMQTDVTANGRSMRAFTTKGPLLNRG